MKNILAALILCLALVSHANAADERAARNDLQQRIAKLKTATERAEAIRAVKRLQYAYGQYAEFGLWNDLADLFANNGVGHFPSGDLDKEGIRQLFLRSVGKGKLGLPEGALYSHIILQPVVTLAADGRSAKGRWRVCVMLGQYGLMAVWSGGVYENDYVLEDGVWKIKDLHFYSQYSGKYEDAGWTAGKDTIPMHYDPIRRCRKPQ